MDATERSFLIAANQLSIDVNCEFLKHPPNRKQKFTTGPLFIVMMLARKDALQAHAALVNADPSQTEVLRKLQNEVQRYFDLAMYVREIFDRGDEAYRRLTEEDAEELREDMIAEGLETAEG